MTFGKSFAVVCQIIAKQGMRTEKESNLELSIYYNEVKTTIKLQLKWSYISKTFTNQKWSVYVNVGVWLSYQIQLQNEVDPIMLL